MSNWSGGSSISQDWVHYKVHVGAFFQANQFTSGLASAASFNYMITTGSNYSVHSGFTMATTGQCQVTMYEAPTATSGTTLTVLNKRRSSSRVTESQVVYAPTITSYGTMLDKELIPAGDGSKFSAGSYGGVDPRGAEWIMNRNTKYLINVVNTSGNTIDLSFAHGFYENG